MQKNNENLGKSQDSPTRGEQRTAWDDLKNTPRPAQKNESNLEDDLMNIQDMLKHGKISEEQADKYTKEAHNKAEAAKFSHLDDDAKKALDDDLMNIQDMLKSGKISEEQADQYTKEVQDKAIRTANHESKTTSVEPSAPVAPAPKPSTSSMFKKKFINPYRPYNPEESRLDAILSEAVKKDRIPREQKAQFHSEADMDTALGKPQVVMPESTSQNIVDSRGDDLAKAQELELQKHQELELQKQQELKSRQHEEGNKQKQTGLEEASHKMEDWLENLDSLESKIEAETEKRIAEQAEMQKAELYKIKYEINQIDQELSKLDEEDLDSLPPKKRIIKKRIIKRIVKKAPESSPKEQPELAPPKESLESVSKELLGSAEQTPTDAEIDQLNTDLMTEIISHADLIGGAKGVAYVMSNQLLDDSSTDQWEKWWGDLSEEAKKYVKSISNKINSLDSNIRFQIPWGWGFRSWLASNEHNANVDQKRDAA